MNTENKTAPEEIRRAREMARIVIAHHFGNPPRRLVHQAGGLSNLVFAVNHAEGDFVVRISPDPARFNSFIKEQWAQAKAAEKGVPIPEVLEVGNDVIPQPFMISRTVAGHEATFHPQRLSILREMGRFAALINSIPTDGFGNTFDWSNNQLSRNATWEEFLEKELQFETKLEILEKRKMLAAAQIKKIRQILRRGGQTKPRAVLNHGDIRLKNVIVNAAGEIQAILDWENCISGIAPAWELSLALHDLSIDEKQTFLEGYGISEKELIEIAPLIKAINFLNYAPEIERLAEAKDTLRLAQYRTRLNGILDFYSLGAADNLS